MSAHDRATGVRAAAQHVMERANQLQGSLEAASRTKANLRLCDLGWQAEWPILKEHRHFILVTLQADSQRISLRAEAMPFAGARVLCRERSGHKGDVASDHLAEKAGEPRGAGKAAPSHGDFRGELSVPQKAYEARPQTDE